MPTVKSSKRLKGDRLVFKLGLTDYAADSTNVVLDWDDADSGTVTFADAQNGGAFDATLSGSGVQSTDPDSFWTWAWDNVGAEVPFVFAPWANDEPTEAQPHFTGTAKVGKRPTLGGDAQIDGDDYTFEFEWKVVTEVERVTTSTGS